MGEQRSGLEAVLEALGDAGVRQILVTIETEPLSARAIAERLELSLPTIYRRLDTLESLGLVVARNSLAESGNHHRVYECAFRRMVVDLDGEGFEGGVDHGESFRDQFAAAEREAGES